METDPYELLRKEVFYQLNNNELTDLLEKIIIENNILHTINRNGIFINISLLDYNSLLVLKIYLDNKLTNKNSIEDIIDYKIETVKDNKVKKNIENINVCKNFKKIKLNNLQEKILSFSY